MSKANTTNQTNRGLERCPDCHCVIIPDEVIAEWFLKFGTRIKPHYNALCVVCGQPYGEHYPPAECPTELKKLEAKWRRIWHRKPQLWDTLDNLENQIAKITGETSVEVNQRLYKLAKQET